MLTSKTPMIWGHCLTCWNSIALRMESQFAIEESSWDATTP